MVNDYNISSRGGNTSLFGRLDMTAVGLYIALVIVGFVCITAASFEEESLNYLSLSHNYMKQLMWIGISAVVALVILLLDRRLFHMFAYPAYIAGLGLLVACLLFGREVNGAKGTTAGC